VPRFLLSLAHSSELQPPPPRRRALSLFIALVLIALVVFVAASDDPRHVILQILRHVTRNLLR